MAQLVYTVVCLIQLDVVVEQHCVIAKDRIPMVLAAIVKHGGEC